MTKNCTVTALAIGLLGTTAFAQSAAVDTNGDGMYSLPEVQAAMPDMSQDDFVLLDANGDGLLDADEIAAGTEAGILPAMDG